MPVNPSNAPYFNVLSYTLSRFAFIGTHVVFAFWLLFLFNDPFDIAAMYLPFLSLPTLDVPKSQVLPAVSCTRLILPNLYSNLFFFSLWVVTHSGLARTVTKKALGLEGHPVERPLYAAIATIVWFVQVYMWKPITDCVSWDVLATPPLYWAISGMLMLFGTVLIVGLLWTLPDHVFGTQKYKYLQGTFPPQKIIKGSFPYGLVRHPAATGFLWFYLALPSYTPNHILLAALWCVYIVIGTLIFEEKGISEDKTEFGREYLQYRKNVHAFYPTLQSVLTVLGIRKYQGDNAKEK